MAAEYAARYARALLDALEGQKADVEAAAQQLGDFKGAWDETKIVESQLGADAILIGGWALLQDA